MPDTRKKYQVGYLIAGFKPGQPPYTVGPDKTVSGFKVHITIDRKDTAGKWDYVVASFHLSFKDKFPQPGAKCAFNSALDRYNFKGWFEYDKLKIDPLDKANFLTKVNSFMSVYKDKFGSSSIGAAT